MLQVGVCKGGGGYAGLQAGGGKQQGRAEGYLQAVGINSLGRDLHTEGREVYKRTGIAGEQQPTFVPGKAGGR